MQASKLIVGNWKMNGSLASNEALLHALATGLTGLTAAQGTSAPVCEVAVCVPAPYLAQVAHLKKTLSALNVLALGAQDISAESAGAFTGDVSALMLRDFDCRFTLVGHSERRLHARESDALVARKTQAALAAGITPIVCIGESWAERESGQTQAVVKRQLAAVVHANGHCISEIVLAYEPVWAIGTGKTATPQEAQEVHALLRLQLHAATPHAARMRILYGGSMNAANAAALLAQPDIDGGLIGGASLKAAEFLTIVAAAGALSAQAAIKSGVSTA